MRFAIIIALVFASTISFGQTLKFKISNHKDTTVNLVRYMGKGLYYADTAEIINGVVTFDGSKQKAGILALFMPDQSMLEFIYNDEDVEIEAHFPDMMNSAKIKKSEENKVFHSYVTFMNAERQKANKLTEQRNAHEKGSEMYEKLNEQLKETTQGVVSYQQKIVDEHWDLLAARIVKMSMDVVIPEAPTNDKGEVIDSNFRFNYYRAHYFDNIDFKDDRLVRTPIFHSKLSGYFDKTLMYPHCDTVIKYAFDLCDQFPEGSDTYQYGVSWITSTYEKSKIMNMDKVFVWMAERYYCAPGEDGKPKAFWLSKENLDKICDKSKTNKNLVFGMRPPNIILRDTTDVKWVDFYSLDNDYTILYFWDPDCGHCKKITPKLQTLYSKKFKEHNIDIFSVGKASGDDFAKWKKFIKNHNLEFINVGVTHSVYKDAMDKSDNQAKLQELLKSTTLASLNYQQTYDIYTTPRVFVLDKDKKIIAKSLTVSQLEDLMDRLQGFEDSEKLFPKEEEKTEDSTMH